MGRGIGFGGKGEFITNLLRQRCLIACLVYESANGSKKTNTALFFFNK